MSRFIFAVFLILFSFPGYAQTYYWSGDLSVSGSTATGSVAGQGYSITTDNPIKTSPGMFAVSNFPDAYAVPGDAGTNDVTVFREEDGSSYTLTFDQPVENPLVAIASLGNPYAPTTFNFGAAVEILWSTETTVTAGTASSATQVSGREGYLIAKYPGTVTSVTFSVPTGEVYMNLIVGFAVSNTPPAITSSNSFSIQENSTAVGTATANKAVTWAITGGADQALFSIGSVTGALEFNTAPDFEAASDNDNNNSYELTVTATDLNGVTTSQNISVSVTDVDDTAPTVSSVSVPSAGSYNAGDTLSFTVNTSEAVTVVTTGGTPQIALTIGSTTRQASYVSGSTSTALVFSYTVQSGDTDADGIAVGTLSANGGTLKDSAGNDLTLTLNSVGNTASVLVDTTAPTISSVSLSADNSSLTVTFSESVYSTNGGSGDLAAADFALSISGGTATVTSTPSSITKTSQSVWVLGVSLSGTPDGNETLSVVPASTTSIYDVAGNAASTTQSNHTASLNDQAAPTFDVAPSVGSVTSSGFTPSASIDEAGKIYYVVVADGATAPSAAQVKTGADYSGVTVLAAANATVSSSPFTSSFSAITSLSDNTAYDVYFIAEDDEGTPNLQSSVTKVDTTTLDATAPTLSSSSPSDNATGVAVGANIVLTFNENVQAGTGNIVISNGSSDTRTIAIGDGQVSISGAVVTINSTANLSSSTSYYVQVASTAIEDTSGNAYAGISDTTTLNFTTVDTAAPTATFNPLNGATDVAVDANITITFNEAIRLVNDSALTDSNVDALITLKDTNSSGSNIAFDATISGNVITVNPSSDFSASQQVYVAIGTTVEDTSDNAYTGGSATFTVTANTQTPATEFAENVAAIRAVLVDDMMRSVRSSLSVSRRMISDARNRLIAFDRDEQVLASSRSPLTIDGVARADAVTVSTRGTASSSFTRNGGVYRRLFFSDFDIQHNTDTDSTTATLSARVTWEHMTSDSTMLGYFVGVEAAESDLNGTFAGDQTRLGVSAGGYLAHRLADQLYMDAYVSIGVGHSELDMSNGTLALESDYRSETVTIGAALSGVYDYDAYEFRPEIAFNYGRTELGQVFFTGRAYGLVDDTLTLNAGSVSVANLTLRPEVRMDIDQVSVLPGAGILSFSPRLICERTMSTRRTQNCGSGGEVGYTAHSNDGLRNIDFRIMVDKVGSDSRSSAVFGVEMRF